MKYLRLYNEIVDYKELYSWDIEQLTEYHDNLYYYSDKKIELSDFDDMIRCDFHNRADSSDTNSDYIYQIKTKYHIYKKSEFSFDNEDMKEPNSGYFKKDWITSQWFAWVKKSDVISFKFIGGFAKYDKNISKKLDIKLSEETEDFLYSYIGGTILHKKLTNDIKKELSQFKQNEPFIVYKGIEEVQIKQYSDENPPYKNGQIITFDFNHLTSWTKNILIARRFIDDYPSSQPFVISNVIYPNQVLCDVTMLPGQYYHSNQREIILLPGKYQYKIIWVGESL